MSEATRMELERQAVDSKAADHRREAYRRLARLELFSAQKAELARIEANGGWDL